MPAYRETKRAESRDAIQRAARALLTSDGWRKWAETRATFHDYSLNNCMLIAMQSPEATHVAGFKAWKQLGRHVRKGEHSIKIMAPMVVKQRNDKGGKPTRRLRCSARSPSSTYRRPTASRCRNSPSEPVTGNSHAHYIAKLERFAQSIGYRVEYRPLEHSGGFCRGI